MNTTIQLNNISQSFSLNDSTITLFEDINLNIHQGQSYAITGPSGSAKSSLLMLMSGLEQPTSGKGTYFKAKQAQSLKHPRTEIGFVFQQFHLLPELTALNNVALPLRLRGDNTVASKAKAMLDRMNHNPKTLSGGEQQRLLCT